MTNTLTLKSILLENDAMLKTYLINILRYFKNKGWKIKKHQSNEWGAHKANTNVYMYVYGGMLHVYGGDDNGFWSFPVDNSIHRKAAKDNELHFDPLSDTPQIVYDEVDYEIQQNRDEYLQYRKQNPHMFDAGHTDKDDEAAFDRRHTQV